jgi:hypothetical protein
MRHKVSNQIMKLITLLLCLPVISVPAQGQTLLPPEISNNTTLTSDHSPYLVQNNLTVNSGIELRVEAGVVIEFASSATMTVYGSLLAQGTAVDSIYFMAHEEGTPWQQINTSGAVILLQYCSVSGGKRFLASSGGNTITVTQCSINSVATGSGDDCIEVHDVKKVNIAYSRFTGMGGSIAEGSKNDAIDLDHVDSCFVQHCIIADFSDDGIDIGTTSKYALLAYNNITHCNYGISVGESTVAYINNNIITHCDAGLQVHNDAIIHCNYNTLYFNRWAIECFHSEEGNVQTGGTAWVENTIFSGTVEAEIISQASSTVTISYSISDKEILPGSNNLFGDPQFIDPEHYIFSLQSGSPCIDAGSPDGEGNRTTMGAMNNHGTTNIPDFLKTVPDFLVYPNPAVDKILVETKDQVSLKKLELYNSQGILLLSKINPRNPEIIDLRAYPAGIYFLRLSASPSTGIAVFMKR